jgi:hypothetical protein
MVLKMSFLAQTPYGQPPTRVTVRDKTSFDEAGYEFQEPLVEQIKVPKWYSPERAAAAYEQALRRENPDLHAAPKAVERLGNSVPVQRGKPDAACLTEGR